MLEKKEERDCSPGQREQLRFWSRFEEFAFGKVNELRFLRPYPNYYDIDFGFKKPVVYISPKMTKESLRCEIDIPSAHKTNIYQRFLSHKEEIEKNFGEKLQWIDKARTIRRIRISREDFNIDEKDRWSEYFEWLTEKIKKFQKVFSKYK